MYQVIVKDKQIVLFNLNSSELEHIHPESSVTTAKLFSNDIVDKSCILIHSYIRTGEIIPGVLILNGNKTYGKISTTSFILFYIINYI